MALGNPSLELFVTIAATCVASANLGLLLSALAKSNEQIMPLLVVAIMSQLVFSGGMIPVTDRLVLDQLSWLTPARWGFAASASTVDLIHLVPGPLTPKDHWWGAHRLELVVRHGHAHRAEHRISAAGALEDPAQDLPLSRRSDMIRRCRSAARVRLRCGIRPGRGTAKAVRPRRA